MQVQFVVLVAGIPRRELERGLVTLVAATPQRERAREVVVRAAGTPQKEMERDRERMLEPESTYDCL